MKVINISYIYVCECVCGKGESISHRLLSVGGTRGKKRRATDVRATRGAEEKGRGRQSSRRLFIYGGGGEKHQRDSSR